MTDFSTLSPYRASQGVPPGYWQYVASPAGARNSWSFFSQKSVIDVICCPHYWGVPNNEVSTMREFAVIHQGS